MAPAFATGQVAVSDITKTSVKLNVGWGANNGKIIYCVFPGDVSSLTPAKLGDYVENLQAVSVNASLDTVSGKGSVVVDKSLSKEDSKAYDLFASNTYTIAVFGYIDDGNSAIPLANITYIPFLTRSTVMPEPERRKARCLSQSQSI